MAVVVVGGHSRNIGKTSVVAGLIAAMPQMRWTAFKITQFGHGICSANGDPCDCETDAHLVAVAEEKDAASGTDSARFLLAGAERSFWVRTRQGNLAAAMPRVRRELLAIHASGGNALIESNSVLRFLQPDLYLAVLDAATADFKDSARAYLDRADAVLLRQTGLALRPLWTGVSWKLVENKPRFVLGPPEYMTSEVAAFVRDSLASPARANVVPASVHGKGLASAQDLVGSPVSRF